MADTTSMQQFERGVKTIDQALRAALAQRGVSFWHIARTVVGVNIHPHDSTFIVWAKDDKEESLLFTREEIADSAERIDSFAAAKVRVLADRCAAWVRDP
jgi:hypothetical protein